MTISNWKKRDDAERDRLANEGVINDFSGQLTPRWYVRDFKAGWDAARANDNERDALYAELIGLEHRLGTQVEILTHKLEKLRGQLGKEYNEAIEISRRDQDKIEDLQETVKELVQALEQIESKPIVHGASWDIAVRALNEYRAKSSCGGAK
jgi:coenzyme F420-reducing hydrogenase delta subunit